MKEITLGIKFITVVVQEGRTDIVYIHTTLAPSVVLDDCLVLKTDCKPGEGVKYCREHFGITPKVIEG
jgi:hypothetical protein